MQEPDSLGRASKRPRLSRRSASTPGTVLRPIPALDPIFSARPCTPPPSIPGPSAGAVETFATYSEVVDLEAAASEREELSRDLAEAMEMVFPVVEEDEHHVKASIMRALTRIVKTKGRPTALSPRCLITDEIDLATAVGGMTGSCEFEKTTVNLYLKDMYARKKERADADIRDTNRFARPDIGLLCQSCRPVSAKVQRASSATGESSGTRRRRNEDRQRKDEEHRRRMEQFWGFLAFLIEYKNLAPAKTLAQTIAYLMVAYQICGTRLAFCWVGRHFSRVFVRDDRMVLVETGEHTMWDTVTMLSDIKGLHAHMLAWNLVEGTVQRPDGDTVKLRQSAVECLISTVTASANLALNIPVRKPLTIPRWDIDSENAPVRPKTIGLEAFPPSRSSSAYEQVQVALRVPPQPNDKHMQTRRLCALARPGKRGLTTVYNEMYTTAPLVEDEEVGDVQDNASDHDNKDDPGGDAAAAPDDPDCDGGEDGADPAASGHDQGDDGRGQDGGWGGNAGHMQGSRATTRSMGGPRQGSSLLGSSGASGGSAASTCPYVADSPVSATSVDSPLRRYLRECGYEERDLPPGRDASSENGPPRLRVPSDLGSDDSDWASAWSDDTTPEAKYSGLEKLHASYLWRVLERSAISVQWISPARASQILAQTVQSSSSPVSKARTKTKRPDTPKRHGRATSASNGGLATSVLHDGVVRASHSSKSTTLPERPTAWAA